MKECSKCGEVKSLDQFYRKNKERVQAYCKPCFNRYCQERWIKRKKNAIQDKGGKCKSCGVKATDENYVIFDFHHRFGEDKDIDWRKIRLVSKKKMKEELSKCDLLCSNCHRLEHFNSCSH